MLKSSRKILQSRSVISLSSLSYHLLLEPMLVYLFRILLFLSIFPLSLSELLLRRLVVDLEDLLRRRELFLCFRFDSLFLCRFLPPEAELLNREDDLRELLLLLDLRCFSVCLLALLSAASRCLPCSSLAGYSSFASYFSA